MSDSVPPQEKLSAEDWLSRAQDAERRGEFLAAYDFVSRGLSMYPDHIWLQHRAVLTLARSGATDQARALFERLGLQNQAEEDIAALGARLAKDYALVASSEQQKARAVIAADLYEKIFNRTGGYYPGINAATMRLLAGQPERASHLAGKVLDVCSKTKSNNPKDPYYVAATEAEAILLLGNLDGLTAALERAATAHGGDYAAIAATRKQLRLVCLSKGVDPAVLTVLKTPGVIHYVGHLISSNNRTGPFSPGLENKVADSIRSYLAEKEVGFGYGSLACGADILFAEALLDRNAELHVVLPFDKDEFRSISVDVGGPNWSARFDRCLNKATAVSYATEDSYLGDDLLFTYASRLAMGLALLRASHLDAHVEQVAVWNGKPTRGNVGTAADVAFWRGRGLDTHTIPCDSPPGSAAMLPRKTTDGSPGHKRQIRAMIFGDVRGFSKLREAQLVIFLKEVMGGFGKILDKYGGDILYRNTWGDGIFLVLSDAPVAAQCALEMQETMRAMDLENHGLPLDLGLRIGAHFGPVFEADDPVVKRTFFFGSHVTRAARLEPATPEGNIYATEPFAARLALDRGHPFACEYVGYGPAAKDYGLMRMYVLKRRV